MSLSSCRHSWIDITGRLVPVMAAFSIAVYAYSILKMLGCIGTSDEIRLRWEQISRWNEVGFRWQWRWLAQMESLFLVT